MLRIQHLRRRMANEERLPATQGIEDRRTKTEYWVLMTEYWFPWTEYWSPRTEHRGSRTEHRAPRIEDRAPRTEDRGPSTEDRGPSTEDRGPRTEHRGPSTEDRGPSNEISIITFSRTFCFSIFWESDWDCPFLLFGPNCPLLNQITHRANAG